MCTMCSTQSGQNTPRDPILSVYNLKINNIGIVGGSPLIYKIKKSKYLGYSEALEWGQSVNIQILTISLIHKT